MFKLISLNEADQYLLQEQEMSLKHANLQMQNSKEELEQYGRWLCLRINGFLVKLDQTSDDVYKSVKKYLMRVNWICPTPWLFELIETSLLDWSWCSDYKTKCKAIIIRFTMFMHIRLVYLARKKIIDNVKTFKSH